jgi:hypothetical protein
MSGYIMNEALFEPPEGWLDGSLNVLRPADDRADLKLLVLRTARGKEPLAAAVAQQKKVLAQRLGWFELLSESETTVGGRLAFEMRATFKDGAVQLYQRRVTFESGDKLVAIVAAGVVAAEVECDSILARALSTLEFRAK